MIAGACHTAPEPRTHPRWPLAILPHCTRARQRLMLHPLLLPVPALLLQQPSWPAMSPSASNAPPPSRSNYHKLLKGTLQGRGRTCWAWRGTPSLSPPPRPQKATPCPGTKAAAATPSAACCTVGPLLALPELLSFPFLLSFSLLLLLLPLPAITHSVKHSSFSSSIILRGNQDGTALTSDFEILIRKKRAQVFYPETKYRGKKGP